MYVFGGFPVRGLCLSQQIPMKRKTCHSQPCQQGPKAGYAVSIRSLQPSFQMATNGHKNLPSHVLI